MGFSYTELLKYKEDAFIGYLKMKIYDPPKEATWGRFNDRVVNEDWVAELVTKFRENFANCTTADAIDVSVRREWIQNSKDILLSVDGKEIKDVSEIEFTPEGLKAIAPDNLDMLGGNHRRLAVRIFVDGLKKQLEVTMAAHEPKEQALEKVQLFQGDPVDTIINLKAKIEELNARIENSLHWAIRLYDKG
jgi:hypothetical protein